MNRISIQTTLRIGVLSYAHIGHALSYSAALEKIPGVELAAIYDEDVERGEQFAGQFGARFYATVAELLDQKSINAVIVTSPTDQHRDLVCAAAQAGKHILCEKPIATNIPDAQAMIAACDEAGVLLQIPFVCRFYPMVQAARRMIQSGEIGRVLGIVGGNRGRPPLPPQYPEWITDPVHAGGGALLDHSVHVTDAMRFILESEASSVYAEKSVFSERGLKVEDCGLLSLVFQNGIIATVDPSWSLPENNPYHYDFYLRILGEKGTLNLDDTRQALTVVSDDPARRAVAAELFGIDVDAEMVRHFIRCVQAGGHLFPAATGQDGLRALEIALAAYESTMSHQPVILTRS